MRKTIKVPQSYISKPHVYKFSTYFFFFILWQQFSSKSKHEDYILVYFSPMTIAPLTTVFIFSHQSEEQTLESILYCVQRKPSYTYIDRSVCTEARHMYIRSRSILSAMSHHSQRFQVSNIMHGKEKGSYLKWVNHLVTLCKKIISHVLNYSLS